VTRISVQLGERLGLDHDELRNLEHGSLLHDVGKIGIPDAILHKPGPLTSSEWDIMRRHPQYAFDILSPLPHLAHALDVPFCHHERYDGSGYPRGLRGHEIPLPARIFAVVDVYDAMTTERPYRPALPAEFAISHLRSHAGTHFDPVVIEAFCLLAEGWTDSEPVQAVP
jgi:HD-GYP domain-containing protein (c-di-GMP phosphodiesterase class II)